MKKENLHLSFHSFVAFRKIVHSKVLFCFYITAAKHQTAVILDIFMTWCPGNV